jgi:glutamate-1-semialdehyde 2,1-aminomutase
MVFSRFFRPRDTAAGARPSTGAESDEPEVVATDQDPEDGSEVRPEELHEPTWAERAADRMPTGSSTGSKRPAALYGDSGEAYGPTHYVNAHDCHVVTSEGDTIVDCTMALGAVAIGYAEPNITRAVMEAAGSGNVAGLAPMLEVEVAERFCDLVPCAEKVQFLKTGAEAMAAAVRIARTYTGRDFVVGCGYFGWHDWASQALGVPLAVQQDVVQVPFDDVEALERACRSAGNRLAAVAIEPVIERLPSSEWIARARALCDELGAVLIFDEMKTGFRLATGGFQEYSGVTPDLATFGKALANGYPLAAVCGHAALMDAAGKTWISSTLASETTSLAAAGALTEIHRQTIVCPELWRIGAEMRSGVDRAIAASGLGGVRTDGIDPMWLLRFEEPAVEAMFLRRAARHGVLFKRGAYNFAALAHDEDALRDIEAGASNAFVEVREAIAADA